MITLEYGHDSFKESSFNIETDDIKRRFDLEIENRKRDIDSNGISGVILQGVQKLNLCKGKEAVVLETGGHTGSNSTLIFNECETKILLDLDKTFLQEANNRGLFALIANLEIRMPINSCSVDVVVACDIIEHLVNTDLFVSEIKRVLKPDGHVIISTPNLGSALNRLLLMAGIQPLGTEVSTKKAYGRPGSNLAGHLRLFTVRALVEMLNDNGFHIELLQTCPISYYTHPSWRIDRLERLISSFLRLSGSEIVCFARSIS